MLKKGFTFLELVLIIVLLAILAVAAIPKTVDMPAMRIDMAARKVQSDIRYAQSLAVSIQKRTRIGFSATDDDYSVYIEDNGKWTLAEDPLTKEDFTVHLNTGDFTGVEIVYVTFDGHTNLFFDKWGNPNKYSWSAQYLPLKVGVVRLTGKVVRVERGTGRVYIQ